MGENERENGRKFIATGCAGHWEEGSAASHRSDDHERLGPGQDGRRQRRARRLVRPILAAGKETDEGPALEGGGIADGSAKDGVAGLESIKDGRDGRRAGDFQFYLAVDAGERAEVEGQDDADHGRVWTSTERTAGRSRTMGCQESPTSGDT